MEMKILLCAVIGVCMSTSAGGSCIQVDSINFNTFSNTEKLQNIVKTCGSDENLNFNSNFLESFSSYEKSLCNASLNVAALEKSERKQCLTGQEAAKKSETCADDESDTFKVKKLLSSATLFM